MQHGIPCAVLAGMFRITPVWLSRVWAIEEDSEGQAVQFRWGGSWGSGTVVHPATLVLCGGYNKTCAALGQVPKQWWSVTVACLVLPSVCCHCGVVVVVKYILYTFLDPCLYFTWTTLILMELSNQGGCDWEGMQHAWDRRGEKGNTHTCKNPVGSLET
jgi:hypothetical protein